jgi:asparagine synthetase B (glutamine-hydrolysing)
VHSMETGQYMRNQLLRDSDWASMASSVELRVPFVDQQLRDCMAATGFRAPQRLGKAGLLRRIAPELPKELWSRPKSGFYLPILEWLQPQRPGRAGHNLGARSRVLAALILAEFGISLLDEGNARSA